MLIVYSRCAFCTISQNSDISSKVGTLGARYSVIGTQTQTYTPTGNITYGTAMNRFADQLTEYIHSLPDDAFVEIMAVNITSLCTVDSGYYTYSKNTSEFNVKASNILIRNDAAGMSLYQYNINPSNSVILTANILNSTGATNIKNITSDIIPSTLGNFTAQFMLYRKLPY